MSITHAGDFIKALDAVKQDYTCVACSGLCKEPVTLSKCFHMICQQHFEGLKFCPECKLSLEGCMIFSDSRLASCVESVKELDKIFENYRVQDSKVSSLEGGKTDNETTKHSTKKKVQKKKENLKKQKENFDISFKSNVSSSKPLEKRNNKGETALHVACIQGNVEKVKDLLNKGASPNTKDNAGWTPLHEVVQNGNLGLVKLLLEHKAFVNVPGLHNETPLHEAIRHYQTDIVEELVKHGADINARNSKGETPMQLADEKLKCILEAAVENIIQSQASIEHSDNEFENIIVYNTSHYRSVGGKLKLLIKHHSNIHLEQKFTKKVTHLIVDAEDVCLSTADVLQGIVNSLWIISSKWIIDSSKDRLEPFYKYEVEGVGAKTYNGPMRSRHNKAKQLPGLFNGCHFYFHNSSYEISKGTVLTKVVLAKLVSDAGGVALRRAPNPESIPESEQLVPYHARKDGQLAGCSHYIIFKDIYEPMYNMKHLKALPVGWLIECIEKYELCEPWCLKY